jgi:HJR/Mrr/RecB family endonuclease
LNALEGLKFALANFSTEKEFSFVYKLKTKIITEKEGRNNYHYFNKKSIFDLLKSSFKDNEVLSSINLINEFISQNNFSIKVKIKSPPTIEVYQTLAKILLEKVSHIDDKDFKDDNLSDADEKKMLKAHNYNSIFCHYVCRLDDIRKHNTGLVVARYWLKEYDSSPIDHVQTEIIFSPTTINNYTLLRLFLDTLAEKFIAKYPHYIKKNGLYAMNLAKKLCPILLEVGDIENSLKLFTLIDYDYKDTNHLVPIIEWCLKNDLSSIEKPLAILTKLEPHHPLIKEALLHLEKVKLMNSSGFTLTDINSLSGIDFELLVINNLKKYTNFTTVESTAKTGDYGADIIVTTNNGTRVAIQCKRFSQKVNLKAVQEITAALAHYHADVGIVISNNGFLNSAINLAKSNDIELWDSEKLLRLLAGESDFSVIFEL